MFKSGKLKIRKVIYFVSIAMEKQYLTKEHNTLNRLLQKSDMFEVKPKRHHSGLPPYNCATNDNDNFNDNE